MINMFPDHLCLDLVLVTSMHACVYERAVKTSVTWEVVIHTIIQQLTRANVLFTVPFSIWGREDHSGETKFWLMKQLSGRILGSLQRMFCKVNFHPMILVH